MNVSSMAVKGHQEFLRGLKQAEIFPTLERPGQGLLTNYRLEVNHPKQDLKILPVDRAENARHQLDRFREGAGEVANQLKGLAVTLQFLSQLEVKGPSEAGASAVVDKIGARLIQTTERLSEARDRLQAEPSQGKAKGLLDKLNEALHGLNQLPGGAQGIQFAVQPDQVAAKVDPGTLHGALWPESNQAHAIFGTMAKELDKMAAQTMELSKQQEQATLFRGLTEPSRRVNAWA